MSNIPYICVPIPIEIYNEFVLRAGKVDKDVPQWVVNVLSDYLERTQDDEWSEAYQASQEANLEVNAFREKFGEPSRGYNWQRVFLPNGSQIYMTYQGKQYFADVRHESIFYEGEGCSPSEFAHRVAGHNRNAWRDIYIKRPRDQGWLLADELRRKGG